MQAETLGARNAVAWYSGTAIQPAKLIFPFGDGNCLKCHADVTVTRDFNNHFHYFLARWQSTAPSAGHCVSCHSGHATDANAEQFLNQEQTTAVCDACHNAIGGGEG